MRMRSRAPRNSLRDQNIDRQILVLHHAMADKIIREPALLSLVASKITERYTQGRMRHGAYLTWSSLLEMFGQPEQFKQLLLEDSTRMRQLRRQSPFVGILTEQERQDALLAYTCGEASIDTLY